MYNFLLDNNLLYKYQSAFLPHHSTVFQLIDIFHNICQAFDNNMFSCIVFCDVSKAFDRVWHKGLLFKLRQNGFEGKPLEWLNSYLSQRKQKVGLKSCFSCLKSIFAGVPQGSVQISNYPLRNNRNISVPFNRTNISQKSCIPSSIRLWNSLEDDLKNLSTLQTFKKHITSSFNNSCVPSHFTIGNRYISILHARLRNNCSNLNNDLFRNHLRDNPLCDLCGMIEDAIHYFFHCRKFTMERQVFNDTVRVFQPLSIGMILCGNFNLNIDNNIVLFRAVHRYIHATKRFKTS